MDINGRSEQQSWLWPKALPLTTKPVREAVALPTQQAMVCKGQGVGQRFVGMRLNAINIIAFDAYSMPANCQKRLNRSMF